MRTTLTYWAERYLGSRPLAPESMEPPDKRPFIFTITAVELQNFDIKRRCVGWFQSLEQAEEHLKADYGDIHEGGTVPWAVIEKCESGVCPRVYKDEARWYQFVKGETGYTVKRMECPERFHGILGWGLG